MNPQADFANKLRLLFNIDFDAVGQWMSTEEWGRFRKNPVDFYMRCDDLTENRLWAIIEARAWKRKPLIAVVDSGGIAKALAAE